MPNSVVGHEVDKTETCLKLEGSGMWKCVVGRTRIKVSLYTGLLGQNVGHGNDIKANMKTKVLIRRIAKALRDV